MPGIDEDILRELMHGCTADLQARSAVTTGIIRRHRRRRIRNRALGVAVTGAAAGTVFAVVASSGPPGGAPTPGGASRVTATPALRLTAAQTALYRLSSAAAAAPAPTGRYVVLTEKQGDYEKISVIDGQTGDIWTYQHGAGVPSELPVDQQGSPTEAAFDAMPTDPSALRGVLLAQAKQQQAQAIAEEKRILAKKGRKGAFLSQPQPSDDDLVFGQATDMLWNPLVGPGLRAAVYKVLADTPGVVVNTRARDITGRSAVEISRLDSAAGITEETFEAPATGAVLETAFVYPGSATEGIDLYQSITSSDTLPPNPYGG